MVTRETRLASDGEAVACDCVTFEWNATNRVARFCPIAQNRLKRGAQHGEYDDWRVVATFTLFVSVTCRYVTDVLPLLPLRNRSHLSIHSCRGGQSAEIVSSQSKIACYLLPNMEGVFRQNPF